MKSELEEKRLSHMTIEKRAQRLMLEQATCRRCGERYAKGENIGRWRCHQHAREADPEGRYPCCGLVRKGGGCVRADHTEVSSGYRWDQDDDVLLSAKALLIVAPLKEALHGRIVEGLTVSYLIRRFEAVPE